MVDRKADKNADIGLFELAYRQPLVPIPPYTGMTFQIDGQAIKKSCLMSHRKCHSDESLSRSVASLFEEEEDGKGKRRAESRSRSLSDNDEDDDEPRSRSASSDTDKPRRQSSSHGRVDKSLIMNMELVKGRVSTDPGNPGNPGKTLEFKKILEILEKPWNSVKNPGKITLKSIFVDIC